MCEGPERVSMERVRRTGVSSSGRVLGATRALRGGLAPAPAATAAARPALSAADAGRGGRGALGGLLTQRSRARSSSSSSIASGRAVIAQQTEGSSPLAACALRRTYGVPADGWLTDHAGTAKLFYLCTCVLSQPLDSAVSKIQLALQCKQ